MFDDETNDDQDIFKQAPGSFKKESTRLKNEDEWKDQEGPLDEIRENEPTVPSQTPKPLDFASELALKLKSKSTKEVPSKISNQEVTTEKISSKPNEDTETSQKRVTGLFDESDYDEGNDELNLFTAKPPLPKQPNAALVSKTEHKSKKANLFDDSDSEQDTFSSKNPIVEANTTNKSKESNPAPKQLVSQLEHSERSKEMLFGMFKIKSYLN